MLDEEPFAATAADSSGFSSGRFFLVTFFFWCFLIIRDNCRSAAWFYLLVLPVLGLLLPRLHFTASSFATHLPLTIPFSRFPFTLKQLACFFIVPVVFALLFRDRRSWITITDCSVLLFRFLAYFCLYLVFTESGRIIGKFRWRDISIILIVLIIIRLLFRLFFRL